MLAILFLLQVIGEIVLPFVFAIFIAYLLNPLILKIQKKIRNRYLAITSFLLPLALMFIGIFFFFGGHLIKDSKRLISSVETFSHENNQRIEEIKSSIIGLFDRGNGSDSIKTQIKSLSNLNTEENKQDLMSTIESVYSFFENSSEEKENSEPVESWSSLYMLIYTILYAVIIMYSYPYFEGKLDKYLINIKPVNRRLEGILMDFNNTFILYFKQRSKVVFINTIILIIAFTVMDLPGAIILGILTGILSYAAHYHYLSLPIVGIGCWVLSMENHTSFFLYFGILLFVFILISILEETVYFDKIMKSVSGMNSAIVLLSFTLWIYVFGGFIGTIVALPLTQLILIYMDHLLLYSKEKLSK